MKRQSILLFLSIVISTFLLSTSCNKLQNQIDDLKNVTTELQKEIDAINSEISGLKTIVNALNSKVYVQKVTQTEGGYVILFTDGTSATLTNGSLVGMMKDEEGVYCWTLTYGGKTEWLLDESGKRMPVSGVTPVMSIDAEGYWCVSYDGGKTSTRILDSEGQPIPSRGDSFIKSITQDDEYVYIELVAGDTFKLPKSKPLSVVFGEFTPVVLASDTAYTDVSIPFTASGFYENQNPRYTAYSSIPLGVSVKKDGADPKKGTIEVTGKYLAVNDDEPFEVTLVVNDGEYRTTLGTVNLVTGAVITSQGQLDIVEMEGTENPREFDFSSNISLTTSYVETDRTWIHPNTVTKAEYQTSYTVDANDSGLGRLGHLYWYSEKLGGKKSQPVFTILIYQKADSAKNVIHCAYTGSVGKYGSIRGTVSGGTELQELDFMPIGGTTLLCFAGENTDVNVTEFGDNAFKGNSGLTMLEIPSSVTTIGASAFSGTSITSINIPETVTEIKPGAFAGANALVSFMMAGDTAQSPFLVKDGTITEFARGNMSADIPDTGIITAIGPKAFSESQLTTVTIPENITSIGAGAFAGGEALETVFCVSGTPCSLGVGAFNGVSASLIIYVPSNTLDIYKSAWPEYAEYMVELSQTPVDGKWYWRSTGTNFWGNMGYHPGSGENVCKNLEGAWWGIEDVSGFETQRHHAGTHWSQYDENDDSYMILKDGFVHKYAPDGQIFCNPKGGKKTGICVYSPYSEDDSKVGDLQITSGAVLWPFQINEDGYMPNVFEVAWFNADSLTLIYASPGTGDWGEATYWHFQKRE